MHASSPGHTTDSLDDDIEVIAMDELLDKNNQSPDDSDDEVDDNGDVALLGHQSPRHHSSSPKKLWPQIKGIVIEVRRTPVHQCFAVTILVERTYITTHHCEPIIHWKTIGSGLGESHPRLNNP